MWKKLREIYVLTTFNALILLGVFAFGAGSAFSGGHAERCMPAMGILVEAQVDPFVLDEIFMRSDPVPQLAGALFNGDIGALMEI